MKVCFLCSGKGNLKNFNTVSFSECNRMELFRKTKNLEYSHVKIPQSMNTTAYHVQCFNTFTTLNFDKSKEYEAAFLNGNCTSAAHSENLKNAVVIKQEESSWSDKEAPLFHEVHEDTLTDAREIKIEEIQLDIKEADPLEVADNETLVSQPSTSGVKDSRPRCIFCSQSEKRAGGRRQYLSKGSSKDKINILKEKAETLGDAKLLEKIQGWDCILYHNACLLSFSSAYKKRVGETKPQGKWEATRELHARAFESLCAFIQTEVIEKEQIFYLTDLNVKYKAMLLEFNTKFPIEEVQNCTVGHLNDKILKKFRKKIIIRMADKGKQKIIVYKQGINKNKINDFFLHQTAEITVQQSVAYDIRNAVKSIVPKKLKVPLKVEQIIEGECDVPYELLNFMCDLIQGPDKRPKSSIEDLVKIKSVCQDIIYVTTKGRVKPSKHLVLALALKSPTGSRNSLALLNKYGHAVNYPLALEVESALISSGLSTDSNVFTNVALDNCDTASGTGKETPNNDDSQSDVELPTSSSSDHTPPERKRRRYGGRLRDILKNYGERDKETDAEHEHLNDEDSS